MTRVRSRRPCAAAPIWLLALVAQLAGCQPLPHPFADDRPPAALLKIRDTAGVSIAPIDGRPAAVAAKLGAATAGALLKRDIPASAATTSLNSYLLYGRVVESPPKNDRATITALWRLYDAKGEPVGERSAKAEAKPHDWEAASDAAVEHLAMVSAEALAPLLADEAPAGPAAAATADSGRVRVAVGAITGAPGDGATSLASAVAAVLKRQDLAVAGDKGNADLVLDGEVAVAPAGGNKQHVKIVWHMRRADGAEIGTVGQENDVPKGMLDGAWGDVAYSVAIAARDGLMQLVARGAPPPKS